MYSQERVSSGVQSTPSDQTQVPPYNMHQEQPLYSQERVNSGVQSTPFDQTQVPPYNMYQEQPLYSQERNNSGVQSTPSDQPREPSYNTYQHQPWYSPERVNTGVQSTSSYQHGGPSYCSNQHQAWSSHSNTTCYPGYNASYSQGHFQGQPTGGCHSQTPTGQESFYPEWDQHQFRQAAPSINPWGYNTRGYNTRAPCHEDSWQQLGAQNFVQHGATYFNTQNHPFVQPATAQQWSTGYRHADAPRPF